MAIYTFRNIETEEVEDFHIRMNDLEEETARLKEEGWERVYIAPNICWRGTGVLGKLDNEFNDNLKEMKKFAGKSSTINTK